MPPDPDRILSEFIDAWNAGRRPDVDDYVGQRRRARPRAAGVRHRRVPRVRADPGVRRRRARGHPGRARRRRRGGRDPRARRPVAVAAAAAAKAGGPEHGRSSPPRSSARSGSAGDSEPKTRDYLERLEAGELEPRGLSGRLLDGLARLLGVPRTELEGAGGVRRRRPPRRSSVPRGRERRSCATTSTCSPTRWPRRRAGTGTRSTSCSAAASADAQAGPARPAPSAARDEPVELHVLERAGAARPASGRCAPPPARA